MLDPEFWLDEELATVPPTARLLYMGLWNLCDDNYATLPNKPSWIKVQVFPYESVNIPRLLDALSGIGKIILFRDGGEEFWYIKNFFKYQRVEKPSKAKYPKFTGGVGEESGSTPADVKLSKEKLIENNVREESVREEKISTEDGGGGKSLLDKRRQALGI